MLNHPSGWERVIDALSKIGGFLLGIVALWGIARGIPRLLNHSKVVRELLDECDARKRAENAAKDYREAAERSKETADTYRKLYEAQHDEENELRAEMAQERVDRALILEQMTSAFLYLVDVIAHFKGNGAFANMPSIPDNLQEGIAAAMAERARKLRGAPKSDMGFTVAPEEGA